MEQLTKNQAVATSQEAVQNQNEPQLRDENAHNDKSVHGVLNPNYQAGLRRDAEDDEQRERIDNAHYPNLPDQHEDKDTNAASDVHGTGADGNANPRDGLHERLAR